MRTHGSRHADAYIVTKPNHAILLPVADCVGAALYDSEHGVLMVSHLGRHSLEQNGAYNSVKYLIDHFQSDPKKLGVYLTPAASKDNYPIWALDNMGLKEATFQQLEMAGVPKENILDNPAETDKDERYFSFSEYRQGRRPEDGDHAIVAMIRE
jgi:copper oxidase (laccase) domain-containing protein